MGPLKGEFSLKFRASFENFEKDKKNRRFQFGGTAEDGNFGTVGGNFQNFL